jgi:hypothetical protein
VGTGAAAVSDFDRDLDRTNANLAERFRLRRGPRPVLPCLTSIGFEVEVPHSAYFPDLWERYGLQTRRVAQMPAWELAVFSRELEEAEGLLRPVLAATIECGTPRGNDRYWEFSLRPAHDLGLVAEQLELLTACGALPRPRPLELHATIANVRRTGNLYFLVMAAELLYVQPPRIAAVVAATRNAPIFTGWGRKGQAGVFEKGCSDLQGGAQQAVEIRTLQLLASAVDTRSLLRLLAMGSDALVEIEHGTTSVRTEWLRAFRAEAEAALRRRGLPIGNWWRGGPEDGIRYDTWAAFVQEMDSLRAELGSLLAAGVGFEVAAGCPGDDAPVSRSARGAPRERAA